jgi:threonine synthase
MKYHSTNKNCKSRTFKHALLKGLANDKGLFMPDHVPRLSSEEIDSFRHMKYHEIAFNVLYKFLKRDIPKDVLKLIIDEAYNFPVPIEEVYHNVYILRLDQGPTLSFKDFAARLMARLMNYYLKEENKKIIILVATSGDTGSAIADAYFDQDNTEVIILFPKNEVSSIQRKQMTTYGRNIYTIALEGKFDDCQNFVKKAFSDVELNYLNLSSANSINIGRLLPQIVYYFYAFSRIDSKEIVFSVPSGNFGNLMGGIIARTMGLPVKKFIVAVNENDEFVRFFQSTKYKPIIPSINCISNAMNVGNPSNFTRLIELYGGHMSEKGKMIVLPDIKKIHNDFFPVSVTDQNTILTIQKVYKKYNTIVEPHGAVAWKGVEKYLEKYPDERVPIVSLETAHPSKFPSQLEKLYIKLKKPYTLVKLEQKEEVNFSKMKNNYTKFKNYLKKLKNNDKKI